MSVIEATETTEATEAPYWQICGAERDDTDMACLRDLRAELKAAQDGAVIAPLTHFGLIVCAGVEARGFLHAQVTSDINHLREKQASYAGWCNAKGRLLANFLLWQTPLPRADARPGQEASGKEERFVLQLSRDLIEPVLRRLRLFILRTRADLDVLGAQRLFGLSGDVATDRLQASVDDDLPTEVLGVWQGRLRTGVDGARALVPAQLIRLGPARWQLSVDAADATRVWLYFAEVLTPVGADAWRWLEVRAGTPWISAATSEAFVPQMIGLDRMGGVSFHKGCYPGQEVVARARYLGKVKRHLFRLQGEEPMHAGEPTSTLSGRIVNAALTPEGDHCALAVLQAGRAESATRVFPPRDDE